jgi:uncharacterized phage protein (TIGR02218 family)
MANLDLGSRAEFFSSVSLRRARLIKIQPVTGLPIRLTTSPTSVIFEGNVFVPVLATNMSAQTEGTGAEAVDTEISGVIDSDLLTNADLNRGVYRGAQVTEYLVDPKFPFAGALRTFVYYIQDVEWNGEVFEAKCSGIVSSLSGKKGSTFSRQCVVDLGGKYCKVNLNDFRHGAGLPPNPPNATPATITGLSPDSERVFFADNFPAGPGAADPSYFQFGVIEFVSGSNRGRFATVIQYDPSGDKFTIAEPPPFAMQAGDAFFVIPGCDKTQASCKDKFNNFENFQGNPFVRGSSAQVDAPAS